MAGEITFAADGNVVVFTSAAGNSTVPNEADPAQVSEKMLQGLTAGEAANPSPQPYSTDTSSPTPPGTGGRIAGDAR